MPSFAAPLIKMVAACCLVLAPLSALAGPISIVNLQQTMLDANDQDICHVLASLHPSVDPRTCAVFEKQKKLKLVSMVSQSTPAQRQYYWNACLNQSRLEDGIEFMGMAACIQYTQDNCPANPPGGNYRECLTAIDNNAYKN